MLGNNILDGLDVIERENGDLLRNDTLKTVSANDLIPE